MSESTANAKQLPLWRYGAYVGNDYRIVVHLFSPGCLEAKRLAESTVTAEGNADLSALFGITIQDRNPSPWEVRSNDIDDASSALSTFVDILPLEQFTAFMEKNPAVRGELSYENNASRGSLKFDFRKRKPVREHHNIKWWSAGTGYKDVSYEEFVRIEGEAPETWEPGC